MTNISTRLAGVFGTYLGTVYYTVMYSLGMNSNKISVYTVDKGLGEN